MWVKYNSTKFIWFVKESIIWIFVYKELNLLDCTDIIEVVIPVDAIPFVPVRLINPIDTVPIPGKVELNSFLIVFIS